VELRSVSFRTPKVELAYLAGGLLSLVAFLALAAVGLSIMGREFIFAAIFATLIGGGTWLVFRTVLRRPDTAHLRGVLAWALVAKAVAVVLRYLMVTKLYGYGDSLAYHSDGAVVAEAFRSGAPAALDGLAGRPAGTARIAWLTGYLYTATGPNVIIGFLFFGWIAFLGQVLAFFGARRAVPELDERRLAIFILFFPSLLFWPSSIGKDAWMMLGLGFVAYGAGVVLTPRAKVWGLIPLLAGVGWMSLVRPHIAFLALFAFAVAAAVAALFRSNPAGRRKINLRVVLLAALVLVSVVASQAVIGQFGEDLTGSADTGDALQETLRRTSQGGSGYAAPTVASPLELPWATVTVLFRPFPWEATGVGGYLSAVEALLLLACLSAAARSIWRNRRLFVRRPYLAFCVAYGLMFVVPFSYIGNFGILARQRPQMLIFVLVLLALPRSVRASAGAAPPESPPSDELPKPPATLNGAGVAQEPRSSVVL
jgi:hypothetical protein